MNNKDISTVVITAVVVGSLMYVGGYAMGRSSYSEKIATVSKMFPVTSQVTSLVGKVKEVSGSVLVIDGVSASQNPFDPETPASRSVIITGNTKVVKMQQKSPSVFQTEMLAFQKNSSKPGSTAIPPSPFAETTIKITDLKAGDTVSVSSASDILKATSFEAVNVQVLDMGFRS